MFLNITSLLVAFSLVASQPAPTEQATGFRPLELPAHWRFRVPTPAYRLEDPTVHQGDFQPGIEVEVVTVSVDAKFWHVRFARFGSPSIDAWIAVPDLSVHREEEYSRVRDLLEEFPLLHDLLSAADLPWELSVKEIARTHLPEATTLQAGTQEVPTRLATGEDRPTVWGIPALEIAVDGTPPMRPRLVIEFWNKGDAWRHELQPHRSRQILRDHLLALERAFDQRPVGADRRVQVAPTIGAVRDEAELFYLPNDTIALLRYRQNEYLILELHSYSKGALSLPAYDPATFAGTLMQRVTTHPEGYRYLSEVPMIHQGEKGYCVSASLARILNYYGQAVDMHALAHLANTEAQQSALDPGGTHYRDLINAMRRLCSTTPFQLRELRSARKDTIRGVIEEGKPILWLTPGHANLIIGMHPQSDAIVYSDSWGAEHAFKVISWEVFFNHNRGMWVLDVR